MINEILSSAICLSIIFDGGGRIPSYPEEYHHSVFNIDSALFNITTDSYEAYYSALVPTLIPVRDVPTTVSNDFQFTNVGNVIEELYIYDTYYSWAFYQSIRDTDHYGTVYSVDLVSSSLMFYNWENDPSDLTFALIGNGSIYDCDVHITANARGVEIGKGIEYTITPISYTFSASTEPVPLFPQEFKRLLDSAPNSTNAWELMDFKCHIELSSEQVIDDRIGILINQTHSATDYNELNLEELYLKPYSSFKPTTIPQMNFSEFLITSVGGFLDTELWPGFSLGGMLAICVSLGVFSLILKMFVGG